MDFVPSSLVVTQFLLQGPRQAAVYDTLVSYCSLLPTEMMTPFWSKAFHQAAEASLAMLRRLGIWGKAREREHPDGIFKEMPPA